MEDSKGVDVLENEEQQSEQETSESQREPTSALSEQEYEDITDLVILMDEHDLAEVEFEDKDRRIRLKKQQAEPQHPPAAAGAPSGMAHQPHQPPSPAGGGSAQGAGAPARGDQQEQGGDQETDTRQDEEVDVIKSPLVGTFYRASSPDADPYVEEGDEVDEDTIVCIIEAMKVMNEIKAEKTGTVKRILVNDGEAVDFDEPLFEITTD